MPHKRGKKNKSHPYQPHMGYVHPNMGAMQSMQPQDMMQAMQRAMQPNFMGMMQPNFMGMVQPNFMGMMQPNFMGMMQPNMGMLQPNMGMMQPNMGMMQPNMGMMQPNMGMTPINMMMQQTATVSGASAPMPATVPSGSASALMPATVSGASAPMATTVPSGGASPLMPATVLGAIAPMPATVTSGSASALMPDSAPMPATVPSGPTPASVTTTGTPIPAIVESGPTPDSVTGASQESDSDYEPEEEEDQEIEIVDGNPKNCGLYLPHMSKADDVVPIQISKSSKVAAKQTEAKAGRKTGTLNKATHTKLEKEAEEWAKQHMSSDVPPTRRTSRRQVGSTQAKDEPQRQQSQPQPKARKNLKPKKTDFENNFSEEEDNDLEYY